MGAWCRFEFWRCKGIGRIIDGTLLHRWLGWSWRLGMLLVYNREAIICILLECLRRQRPCRNIL